MKSILLIALFSMSSFIFASDVGFSSNINPEIELSYVDQLDFDQEKTTFFVQNTENNVLKASNNSQLINEKALNSEIIHPKENLFFMTIIKKQIYSQFRLSNLKKTNLA